MRNYGWDQISVVQIQRKLELKVKNISQWCNVTKSHDVLERASWKYKINYKRD